MTEYLREWIMRLVGTAFISAAAVALTPDGAAKRVTRLCCGLALILALLSAAQIALPDDLMDSFPAEIPALSREEAKSETRFIIEQRLNEYISTRAKELGLDLKIKVNAAWAEEGFWYPYSVRIEGEAGTADKLRLQGYIETELMIPEERQEWIEQ